jgi:putative PEP-CTERM system TPR-repeat lipoprotein
LPNHSGPKKGIDMPRRVNTRAISASVVLTTLMLAAGLSGCGKTETSASLLADSKQYQQKGDNKAALIQLKNAATKSPEDAEVRFQLASLYNQTGDAVSAEKEIRKAISLHVDSARAAPELAQALLMQGQAQKALDESAAAAAAKASPELLTTRGDAYLATNDAAKARESYQQALVAKPGFANALIGLARLAILEKDADGASRFTEQAISANPKDAAVWFFKGTLLSALGKRDEAIAAYGQTITFKPDHLNARIERAQLELGAKQFDAAKADIDAARKAAPGALQVTYTQALLDFTQGNYAAARESLQKVLRAAPEHMPTILLSGAVELNLGSLEQAAQHFKKYLAKFPDNAYARKLLAQTQLKSSQPVDAVATLAPLLKDGSKDAQLLALAGESSMRTRDFSKATQYFEKASELTPNTAALHTSLGLAKLGQGDQETGILELQRAIALDPQSEGAGIALVRTELGLKHYDKALAAVKALVAAQPQNAAVHNLEGGVYLSKGDRGAARASFEKAASLQPDLFAPVMNLAQLDMEAKKPDAAKQRLLAFLEKNKKSSSAMSALASLALSQKHPEEATTWLEKASAENPEAVDPAKQLAVHYLRTNQQAKALTLIRKLQTANPANADLLDLLGQAQLANNDPAGALETYSKLVNVVPKSAAAQFRLATAHARMKNHTAAADDLKKALALDPGFTQAKLAQVELAMAQGSTDQALVLARQLQKTEPKLAVGFLLEGDILVAQKKLEQAVRPYEQAFAIAKSPQMLIKLAAAMKAAGKTKDADAKLAQWQSEHPAESLVATYVGESYLANKQYKAAIEQFEAILKIQPENPMVLNNLAWVYQEQKDPRALETAERALKFAPDSAAVMDTLGWLLVQQGNVARGLPLLQKAVAQQPSAPELRYHLAFALNKSGDKKTARQELDKLLSDNKPFPQIDEAKALLKIL